MERRSIKTLLSQGAAGGVCGTFLLLCVMVLSYPSVYNYLPAVILPFYLLFGAGIGTVAGAVIWALEGGVDRNWRILSRVAISTLFKVPVFILLSYAQKFDPRTLFYRYTAAILFGLAILLLTSSNIRPWRMIARGTNAGSSLRVLFKRGAVRISQTIEELGLTGLPLRAVSLFALMVSVLLAIGNLSFFWWGGGSFKTFEDFTENLLATAYFSLTVAVSFTVRGQLPVLIMAALLNVPWTMWMLKTDQPNPNAFVLLLVFIFIISWLLFVAGHVISPVKGELQVEYGHTEIRFGKQQWVKESQ